jgi:DNA-binding transcriptional ArsR family regulator
MEYGTDMTRQAITKHLTILEQASLITAARVGRYKQLSLNSQPMSEVANWLSKYQSDQGK